jgi:cytochrome c peroxidase
MAVAARTLGQAFARTAPATASFRPSVACSSARFALPIQSFRASSRRGYTSGADAGKSFSSFYWGIGAVALGSAGAYYYLNRDGLTSSANKTPSVFTPSKDDYQKVYNEIARLLVENDNYDDGSYGPVCYPKFSKYGRPRCLIAYCIGSCSISLAR